MEILGTGILLFITHLLSCFTVGFIFRFWKIKEKPNKYEKKIVNTKTEIVRLSNLGEVIATSIMNSINTIVLIGGFVVLFSVIISILTNSGVLKYCAKLLEPLFSLFNIPSQFGVPFLSGLIELTNGAKEIASVPFKAISTNMIICSFILRFWWCFGIIANIKCNFKNRYFYKALYFRKIPASNI